MDLSARLYMRAEYGSARMMRPYARRSICVGQLTDFPHRRPRGVHLAVARGADLRHTWHTFLLG